jgi:hypothetical protein
MDFFKGKGNMVSSSGDDKPKGPLGFFKGRKPLWWVWWLVRAGALVAVLIGFIMLIVDFYKYPSSNCSWCYRLSCLVSRSYSSRLRGCLLTHLFSLARQGLVQAGYSADLFYYY